MKLEDNFRKAGGEFREFALKDLFTQYRGKEKAPNQNEVGDSQLINETSTNNGWTRLVTPTKIFKGNAITISINYAKTVFYQPKDFCASVNISILRNDKILNRYSGLYIATLLSKSNERYSYTTKTSKDKINNTTILLPAKKDGSLALDYMEAYIKTIELEKLRAIEAYLESIGLKNYELSEEEKEALDLLSRARWGGQLASPLNPKHNGRLDNWGEFRIGSLFSVDTWIYGKNKQYETKFKEFVEGSTPIISGITINNGVNYYTRDPLGKSEVFKDSLTISTRGEYSGTVTYHEGEFGLANNILVMHMPGWNKQQKLYFATLVNNLNYGGYFGYPRKETLKNDCVFLPLDSKGDIDFAFMQTLIKAIEKLVIKDLVVWNEKKLRATKEAIEKS